MSERYGAPMPTIQIRDVPEDVHAVYRARAAAAGLSLQEYLRKELEEGARLRSPGAVAAEVLRERRIRGDDGYSRKSTAGLIRADRNAR